jgi:predicted nucleic acid-binding Zn finger protein
MVVTVSTEDRRSCKALALLEGAGKWLKIRRKSDGVKFYVIPGSAGHVYWTNCAECSCPDAQQRGVECKHITAVKLYCAKPEDGVLAELDHLRFTVAGESTRLVW